MFTNTARRILILFFVCTHSIMVYSQSLDSTNIKISNSLDSTYNFQLIKRDSGLTTPGHGTLKLKNRITPDSASIQKLIKPQIKGRVGLEGYHTSFQNPRMLNEPQYLRLSGTSSVSLGGLPLLVDFYKTTEKQTFYNSNYFKIKFDYQAFVSNITKLWEEQLHTATANADMSKFQSRSHEKLIVESQNQKGALRNQQLSLETKLKEQQEAHLLQYQKQADSFVKTQQDSLVIEIGVTRDSFEKSQTLSTRFDDSMKLEQLKNDTQRIAESIRQIENQLQNLQNKQRQFDSTLNADTAKISRYKRLLENPEANLTSWLKEQGLPPQLGLLSRIKDFQTGIVNPLIHTYSISGVSMKGLESSIALGKQTLNLACGKAIITDVNSYNRANNRYERTFVGADYDLKIHDHFSFHLFGHYAADPKSKFITENRIALQNGVVGINAVYRSNKWPKLDISFAKSSFRALNNFEFTTPNILNASPYSISQQTMSNGAYKILAEKTVIKGFTLEGSTQMVGPRYKNLGNPFMRVNFIEHIAKTKFAFYNNQIRASVFYKTTSNNPLRISEVTNTSSGYGLSLNTYFKNKKLPNFMTSLSPYEQGNNHPDSLFRINSKFSILTAGMTYRTGKKNKYFVMVYGSQSRMQFTDTFLAVVRTLSISQDLSVGKKITLGVGSTFTRTFPSVDSTQANIHQARFTYKIGKSSSVTLTGFTSQFLNGAYRKGGSLNISMPTGKHIKISLKAGYDHYFKLWGIDNKEAFWGLGKIEYRF